MERVTGVEPVYPAWKAGAQPLCHTRKRSQNLRVFDTLFCMVPTEGVEPSFLAEHGPEPCASANSATSAYQINTALIGACY